MTKMSLYYDNDISPHVVDKLYKDKFHDVPR